MITPDDPRHGTTRGYHAGCRDTCCRRAIARYEKAGRLARLRGGRAIPAIGAQRRIRALMRLGWTSEDIARAAGWSHRNQVLRILNGQRGRPTTWLERPTHETVCRVFDELSMRLPEMNRYRRRSRTLAERKGWPPPLAWDNIDDENEQPKGVEATTQRPRKTELDESVVVRVLAGDRLPMTTTERAEVVRRARAMGWSETLIEAVTGIAKATSKKRYGSRDAA